MVKSFFVGLGVTVAVAWGLWGFGVATWHASLGRNGNWWGLWEWISVVPLVAVFLSGIAYFFVQMGEYIRDQWQ